MASLPPPSTSPPHRKSLAKRLEHCCCTTCAFFPLAFVYGLTTWAVFTEVRISFLADSDLYACLKAAFGVILYGLANISYTIAVFTSAGSPLDPRVDLSLDWSTKDKRRGDYNVLPTYEHDTSTDADAPAHTNMTSVTAKSTGKQRYCKKCNTIKPDRTHHCSTCKRCVLKMDHHCPWLATCVGLRNYKPFLLFLIYTCLFCWVCLAVTGSWVWAAMNNDERLTREGTLIVHIILLCVLSGIIGLVLSGFTGWHLYLVLTGQTTIESLEKTRYLNPLRKSMERRDRGPEYQDEGGRHSVQHERRQSQSILDSLKETHANALPGVLRPEEGDTSLSRTPSPLPQPAPVPPSSSSLPPALRSSTSARSSPAKDSLQRSFASLEAQREHDRYNAYLDEKDSEKLPNAFNLGWRRNLLHVFGNRPLLWFLPVCNTSGDGWTWEVSPTWFEARAEVEREREAKRREEDALRELDEESVRRSDFRWMPGQGFVDRGSPYHYQHQRHGSNNGGGSGSDHVQLQPLDRRKGPPTPGAGQQQISRTNSDGVDSYGSGSSDDDATRASGKRKAQPPVASTANWNDIPEDFLAGRKANATAGASGGNRSRSRDRREKGD